MKTFVHRHTAAIRSIFSLHGWTLNVVVVRCLNEIRCAMLAGTDRSREIAFSRDGCADCCRMQQLQQHTEGFVDVADKQLFYCVKRWHKLMHCVQLFYRCFDFWFSQSNRNNNKMWIKIEVLLTRIHRVDCISHAPDRNLAYKSLQK